VRAIVSVGGEVLGALPAFPVESPWWADVEPVARYLDALLGVRTDVLRIAGVVGGQSPRGGEVTYLVEAAEPPRADLTWEPVEQTGDHPLRAPYAEPGGPRAILDWADEALAAYGRPRVGPPVQVKTWNLSCVYELPTAGGPVWSKTTRTFESPEPVAIALVGAHDPLLVPTVLAADAIAGRMLLDHIPGEDCWDADEATIGVAIRRWVAVQAALAGTLGDDLPDRRPTTMPARLDRLPAAAADLTAEERDALDELLADLPALSAAVAATGLPETLVHGDFHPGNWRSDGSGATFVDWSDWSRGHPATDVLRLAAYLPPERWRVAVRAWVDAWTAVLPGANPAAAIPLLTPLDHLQAALTYQGFLDHIEPDEYRYHLSDPAEQLRLALATHQELVTA